MFDVVVVVGIIIELFIGVDMGVLDTKSFVIIVVVLALFESFFFN